MNNCRYMLFSVVFWSQARSVQNNSSFAHMSEVVIPLGPVLCYSWWHEWPRRPEAVLCLEQQNPFRLNFIQYTHDGKVFSESGWHGQWCEDVCTQTVIRRQKVIQEAGDRIITLMHLRYSGPFANWYHNDFTLLKKHNEDFYVCTGCGHCGFAHPVRMHKKIGVTMYIAEITPHPPMVEGFVVEEV